MGQEPDRVEVESLLDQELEEPAEASCSAASKARASSPSGARLQTSAAVLASIGPVGWTHWQSHADRLRMDPDWTVAVVRNRRLSR